MTKIRDLARILGKTEAENADNNRLLFEGEAAGIDSAQTETIASDAPMKVYTGLDSLPTSGLTAGDQAYVESNNRLYISNGSGWYNVALINLSPTMSLDQSGTVTLSTEGTATTVTITAQDSDNPAAILSYSVESDGNGIGNYTLSQDSSIFTITPLSEDSAANPGTFTLTFKTTDNINTATSDLDFSLTFGNFIDSSASTVFLMKGAGNSGVNTNITYDTNSGSFSFTEGGAPQAVTMTPYRSGGYSTFFDGTGDYLSADLGANIGDGDFTVEAYVYIHGSRNTASRGIFQISNTSTGLQANATTNLMVAYRNSSNSYNWVTYANGAQNNTTTASQPNKWTHVALVRSGSTTKLYIDGTSIQSVSDSMNYNATRYVGIGGYYGTSYLLDGYIRDFRVVKGSAVYTSDFTPPTKALTAIANTELLACHLPYWADGSANDITVAVQAGDPKNLPFGPYDYEPWTQQHNENQTGEGTAVYFDGTADRLELASLADLSGGSWTIEGWYYFETDPNGATYLLWSLNDEATNGYAQLQTVSGSNFLRLQQRGGSHLTNGNTYDMHPYVWYHIAAVWDGTNQKVYVNGKERLSSTTNVIQNSGNGLTINGDGGGSYEFAGYISNFRVSAAAEYTAEFTPTTVPLLLTSDTKLLTGEPDHRVYDAAGANGMILFDNVVSSTTQRKWTGSSAIYFPGDDASIHMDPGESVIDWETLDYEGFTIEGWFYTVSGGDSYYCVIDSRTSASNGFLWTFASNGKRNNFYHNGWKYQASSDEISYSTWTHVALTARRNNTCKIYVGGTEVASFSSNNSAMLGSGLINWGDVSYTPRDNGVNVFKGYWQDLRVSRGFRYTAAFTPPTAEFEL